MDSRQRPIAVVDGLGIEVDFLCAFHPIIVVRVDGTSSWCSCLYCAVASEGFAYADKAEIRREEAENKLPVSSSLSPELFPRGGRQRVARVFKLRLRVDLTMNTLRHFSSSARVCGFISNIGKQPIPIPPNVTLTPSSTSLVVKGPLGETTVPLEPYMQLSFPQPDVLSLAVEDGAIKHQRAMWGTTRSLIHNAITGMTNGFSKPLYLVGVGYRAALEDDPRGTLVGGNGKRLNLKLGHSHNIFVPIPAHITAEVPSATKIVLGSTNNVALGHFAAKIRRLRPPEPYKGKVGSTPQISIPRLHGLKGCFHRQ